MKQLEYTSNTDIITSFTKKKKIPKRIMKDEANYVIKIYTNSTIKLLSQAHAQKTSSWKDLSFQELDL